MAEASKKKSSSKATPEMENKDVILDESFDDNDILEVGDPEPDAVIAETSAVDTLAEEKIEIGRAHV